jgi:eukaryotic-like serine/threonine-protein kinase
MLSSGTQLGTYEVVALIGVGGMGEVYQARDRKLGREVAIKVLPEQFSRDPERLVRFQREAKLLASQCGIPAGGNSSIAAATR